MAPILTLLSPLMTPGDITLIYALKGKRQPYESGARENIAYIKELYKKNISPDPLRQS